MAAKVPKVWLRSSFSKVLCFNSQLCGALSKCNKNIFLKRSHESKYSTSTLAEILGLPKNQPPKEKSRTQTHSHSDSSHPDSQSESHSPSESSALGSLQNLLQNEVESTSADNLLDNEQGFVLEDIHDFSKTTIRTQELDPVKHIGRDLFKYYTVKPDAAATLQLSEVLRKEFAARSKAVHETALMIREPGLECMELLTKSTSKNSVAAKVLLYGKDGCGKSSIFAHALHACLNKEWMIICPVKHYLWNNYFKEIAVSSHKASRVDLPQESVAFLSSIKKMNAHVLSKYGKEMQTQESYTWSKREVTPPETPIEQLIDFGIERPKYSSDVVGVLLKEIRLHSHNWPTPTLLALDGVNSLFGTTRIFTNRMKQEKLPVSQISLVHNLVKLLASDWNNGFALLTADVRASPTFLRDSYHPRNLLQEEGFDALNPFIPIEVPNYSDEEISVALDYFTERNWIQNKAYRTSKKARRELLFLSANNPLFLDTVLRST